MKFCYNFHVYKITNCYLSSIQTDFLVNLKCDSFFLILKERGYSNSPGPHLITLEATDEISKLFYLPSGGKLCVQIRWYNETRGSKHYMRVKEVATGRIVNSTSIDEYGTDSILHFEKLGAGQHQVVLSGAEGKIQKIDLCDCECVNLLIRYFAHMSAE